MSRPVETNTFILHQLHITTSNYPELAGTIRNYLEPVGPQRRLYSQASASAQGPRRTFWMAWAQTKAIVAINAFISFPVLFGSFPTISVTRSCVCKGSVS